MESPGLPLPEKMRFFQFISNQYTLLLSKASNYGVYLRGVPEDENFEDANCD
uniref:Uncharacterized protein n=1 Tax=Ipomoea trifida TaxID=35884 RepID=A0A923_IPOTF|nr:hypothetical protein [Ipomoea trifida]